jgi:hypothetical protein
MLRIAAVLALLPAAAVALDDLETMELATNLGAVLAGGEKCGYTFEDSAVIAFVRENVPAEDLGFSAMLNTMTMGAGGQLDRCPRAPSSRSARWWSRRRSTTAS